MSNITICIPTHCIKTEVSGQYKGMNQIVPTAPGTKLVQSVIKDLLEKTNLPITTKIHIGFDKRNNRSIDMQYEENLKLLSQTYSGLKVIINESDIDDPITTAPRNFISLIDSVETKYYLFWEHDWIFLRDIKIQPIIDELDKNSEINWIKFSQFPNNNSIPGVHFIPEEFKNINPSKIISLLPTTRWSNNPYICRTEIFQKWWKTFIYPTNDEGGFVEGPLNVFYNHYMEKLGTKSALDVFKCFIYGDWNDPPTIKHLNGYWVV